MNYSIKTWRQILAISWLNLRSLAQRRAASAVLVCGIAGVVLVLVSLLSMARGLESTLRSAARSDRVLLLRAGSNSELNGAITLGQLRVIADAPGIAKDAARKPLVAGEIYTSMFLNRTGGRRSANLPLRGVSPESFGVRPEVRIVNGRNIEFGKFEMIIGKRAAREFAGVDIGAEVSIRGVAWQVVGEFVAADGAFESEAWADVSVIAPAFKRGPYLSSVSALLESPSQLETLRDAITRDPRLTLQVLRESDYYAQQARTSTSAIKAIGILIGAIMAVGAIFSAINTTHAAVTSRTGEIAMLKALGFHSFPIVCSVLVESTLLAFLGGVIGAAISWLLFDGVAASTVGATFAQVAFQFAVTFELVATGLLVAVVLGFFGGLLPAIRAAKTPIISGLAAH